MFQPVSDRSVISARGRLVIGASMLALVCAAQPAFAQDQAAPATADQVAPPKPAGVGSAGTFSGNGGPS